MAGERVAPAPVPYYRGMSPSQFKDDIAKATTARELRAAVDQFVPTFANLSNAEKNLIRKKWKARQEELDVKV